MKKKFEINQWLQTEPTAESSTNSSSVSGEVAGFTGRRGNSDNNSLNDVETIIQRLESAHTDITASYSDWRDIGFAFADEFGEAGRDYFHRVSRYYPGYSQSNCDKQYDNCLKSSGHGVTIKSFFHLAQQAGISLITTGFNSSPVSGEASEGRRGNVETKSEIDSESIFNTPKIPTEVYSQLPEILRESCEMFADAIEKDVFLIGAIAVISGSLPNIEGIYFDEPHSAHLYSFVTAPAGSGKGKLK